MPTLRIERARFLTLMGREYTFAELDRLGFQFGVEVEEDNEPSEHGPPLAFLKFDCMNNRPDLLTETTLVRAFRMYLRQLDAPQLTLTPPSLHIQLDPLVKTVRPFLAAAVLRNIHFTPESFKALIDAQEKLHATFCRARKYASIGTHDLDAIEGPLLYTALAPQVISFVPLHQEKEVDGAGLFTLLQKHKLKEYLPLLRDCPLYPVLLDRHSRVCSLPPIINSERTKVTLATTNLLIEVTALSRPKALTCLNTLVWAFAQYCAFQVEPVTISDGEHSFFTPDLASRQLSVAHSRAEQLIGAPLSSEQVVSALRRTGLTAVPKGHDYQVSVPFWRGDVLHECDVLEDVAICYGYDNIVPLFPPHATIGKRLPLNKLTDCLRAELAQAQFNEVLNYTLCSLADTTSHLFQSEEGAIRLASAEAKEFQTARTTLFGGLLRTIVQNRAHPLPLKLFEAGDCVVQDSSTDTGARNRRLLAAALTNEVSEGSKRGVFAGLHGSLDLLLKKAGFLFERDYRLVPSKLELFLPGQQFQIHLRGQLAGTLGVVHPRVLKNFGWAHPTALWELDLELLAHFRTN